MNLFLNKNYCSNHNIKMFNRLILSAIFGFATTSVGYVIFTDKLKQNKQLDDNIDNKKL